MNKIPTEQLVHIGVVVKNAEQSAKKFARMYGIAEWAVKEHTADNLTDASTHGSTTPQHYLTATGQAQTDMGPVTFRLIEPRGGWTTYQEFLLTKGEGIHNICTSVIDAAEMDKLQTWLETEGVGIAQQATLADGVREVTLDTKDVLGGFYIQLMVSADGQSSSAADETWQLGNEILESGPQLPLGTFQMHFGVVVNELMPRVADWSRLFGLADWNFMNWHDGPGSLENPEYMGKPVDHAYFTTMAEFNPLLAFEIIQPTFGPSHYKENYRNIVGEGIHHMNASLFPDEETWKGIAAKNAKLGAPVVMGGGIGGGFANFYYLDTAADLGYVTEIIHPGPNWDKGPGGIQPAMSATMG
ncbi:MAG: VOC family protein [Immundisolibacteraceae bacterium]|nr:VOC family protein [Immundisolibacteraceae bacterium]